MDTRRRRVLAPVAALAIAFFSSAGLAAGDSAALAGDKAALGGKSSPRESAAVGQALAALDSWVKGQKGRLSAAIVDTGSGRTWAQAQPTLALNPASNMKLVTVAAALSTLGAEYRFSTGLYGEQKGPHVETLVLRGEGDPSLDLEGLWRLAHALASVGVRSVGEILVDQSFFDAQFVPPAFEQQPNEWASFRAPISAVAVNQNSVTLNVLPTAAGEAAKSWFEPEGIVDIAGEVATKKRGSGQSIQLSLRPDASAAGAEGSTGGRLSASLDGHVSEGMPRMRFAKRLDDPRRAPGLALKGLLASEGIEVGGAVQLGGEAVRHRLVFQRSEPLSRLIHEAGKWSDNFYAEMLFRALGARSPSEPATSGAAATALSRWLEGVGASAEETRIVNGSGLFDANRVSATTLTRMLAAVAADTRIYPEYVAHLAIGGVDGTLRSRLRGLRSTRQVRAKTGTLNKAVALSGYVLRPGAMPPVAFSFLVNDIAWRAGTIRQKMDAVVSAIVDSVNRHAEP